LLLSLLSVEAKALTVPFPYVDVISLTTDDDVTNSSGTLSLTGTADAVYLSAGNPVSITPQGTFTLTATYSASLTAAESASSNTYDFTNGFVTIQNGTTLLTATFSDLKIVSEGTSLFSVASASSPLVYTGGSYAGTLPAAGDLVGSFVLDSFTANGNGVADLSQNFTGDDLTAKVGAVVPLPAALPLLLSGIVGIGVMTGRRRVSLA
jgi:hypothetical protein